MKDEESISELKLHVYGLANNKQAEQYTKTTKAIAEYVGRVYGPEMKVLVSLSRESEPEEPEYPSTTSAKDKAIWSKKYDLYAKKSDQYVEHKAKTFTVIFGRCDEPMKSQVESHPDYEDALAEHDVVKLLRIVKDAAYDANDRKYPPLQAGRAWKNLAFCRQHEKESLLDYYTRFKGLVEIVERTYGSIAPAEIAKKDNNYKNETDKVLARERERMLACMFMDGADKKVYGLLLKKLQDDYSLGDEKYPEDMQEALQVLQLYTGKQNKKKQKESEERVGMSYGQVENRKCYKCGKQGHLKKDCPERNSAQESSQEQNQSANVQVGWHGERIEPSGWDG